MYIFYKKLTICVVLVIIAISGRATVSSEVSGGVMSRNPAIKKLLANNPFDGYIQSRTAMRGTGSAESASIELHSIYCVNGEWFFGIYDIKQKKSYTLKYGEKGNKNVPYFVDSFDVENNSININTGETSFVLTLKERSELTAPAIATTPPQGEKKLPSKQDAKIKPRIDRQGLRK